MNNLTRRSFVIRSFSVTIVAVLFLACFRQPAQGRPASAEAIRQSTGVWVLEKTYIDDQSLTTSGNCYNVVQTASPENSSVESSVKWKLTSDANDECYKYSEPYYSNTLSCGGSAQSSESWTPMPATIVPETKYPMTLKVGWSAEQNCDFITVSTWLIFLGPAKVEVTKPATYCRDNDKQLRGEACLNEPVTVPYEVVIDKDDPYSTGPQVHLSGDSGSWPAYKEYESRYGVPPSADQIEFNFWLSEGDPYISGEQITTIGIDYWDTAGSGVIHYEYHWRPAAPQTAPPTPTQLKPTQAGPFTLEGVVTIEGADLPLGDVPIMLLQNGQLIAQDITTEDGAYQFPLELARPVKDLSILVSLEEAATSPSAFQVIYEPDPDPVYAGTEDFEIPAGEEPTFRRDIAFGGTDLIAGQTIPGDRLQDMGMVYYYTRQAYLEASTYRKQTLDFSPPLTVRINNQQFEALGAFWLGPNSRGMGAGMAPYIGLAERMSSTGQFLRGGGVIWHEFGHDVMADSYGNMMPYDPTGTAHQGFFNPSTTDSWSEGFATFYALLTNRDLNPGADASIWFGGSYSVNMEVNYRSTYGYFGQVPAASREEFAVASLLWDLIDPEDPQDCSPLMYNAKVGEFFKITPVAPITDTKLTLYCDYMQLDPQNLWTMITADASQVDPSPAAGNFAYIYDVKQFYEVLLANGVGEHLTPNGITALNELFIAHGFFADTQPQNFTYDFGEAIGLTSNLAFRRDKGDFPARALRRSPPPLANSYLGVSVQDAQTGQAVEANEYEVTVRFDPPYELYNYSYIAPVVDPGRLYIEPPDSLYDATISVLPVGEGIASAQPVEFTTAQYWEWVGQGPSGNFLEHTFQVDEQSSSYATEKATDEQSQPVQQKTNHTWLIIVGLGCCCLLFLGMATAGGVFLFMRRTRSKS